MKMIDHSKYQSLKRDDSAFCKILCMSTCYEMTFNFNHSFIRPEIKHRSSLPNSLDLLGVVKRE